MSPARRPRRAGVRQTVGLVVEGETEFWALPKLAQMNVPKCPPLKAINLGGVGSDILPSAIANRVAPKVIEHLVAGRSPVVVCIDREQRPKSASKLASEILDALRPLLRAKNKSTEAVYVVAADRAFEAWLLADALGLHARKVFKKKPTFGSFEGKMGKKQRKGVIELGELLDREYRKTTDGPAIFQKIDVATARLHTANDHGSRSFHTFLTHLGV